jgi:hypothetical protein
LIEKNKSILDLSVEFGEDGLSDHDNKGSFTLGAANTTNRFTAHSRLNK